MQAHYAFRRIADMQNSVARDYSMSMQDEQGSCFADLMSIRAQAESQWRNAYDAYLQELRAASAGDDAWQRAFGAYQKLQREYGRIQTEFSKAVEERYERMADTLNARSTEVRNKMLDVWIDYLRDLRQVADQSAGAASTKQKQQS
jgi:hypothetical protein